MSGNPYEAPESQQQLSGDWSLTIPGDPPTVADRVAEFFQTEGYRLEKGTPQNGYYGKGNWILRILLGAFIKRYRFSVQILTAGEACRVTIDKGMSGVSGGVIGYSAMKKELARVREAAQSLASR